MPELMPTATLASQYNPAATGADAVIVSTCDCGALTSWRRSGDDWIPPRQCVRCGKGMVATQTATICRSPAAEAANRIGGAVAYLNSLIKDAHAGGYTVIVSESHSYPGAVGGLDKRMLPRVHADVRAPGDEPTPRQESLDL